MMDAPLGSIYKQSIRRNTHSLNPYYDGCASRLCLATVYNSCYFSLNPYYDGCASRLIALIAITVGTLGLNPYYDGCASRLHNSYEYFNRTLQES